MKEKNKKDHSIFYQCEIPEYYRERDHFDSETFRKGRGRYRRLRRIVSNSQR